MAIFENVKRKRITDNDLMELGPEYPLNKTGKVLPLVMLIVIFAMVLVYFWPLIAAL